LKTKVDRHQGRGKKTGEIEMRKTQYNRNPWEPDHRHSMRKITKLEENWGGDGGGKQNCMPKGVPNYPNQKNKASRGLRTGKPRVMGEERGILDTLTPLQGEKKTRGGGGPKYFKTVKKNQGPWQGNKGSHSGRQEPNTGQGGEGGGGVVQKKKKKLKGTKRRGRP